MALMASKIGWTQMMVMIADMITKRERVACIAIKWCQPVEAVAMAETKDGEEAVVATEEGEAVQDVTEDEASDETWQSICMQGTRA